MAAALHLLRRHGGDLRPERFRIVLRQTEDVDVVQHVGQSVLRRRLNREDAAHVRFGALQLGAVAAFRTQLVDLFEDFGQRRAGHLVADVRSEPIEAGVGEAGHRGTRRVGVALLLPDVADDPRVERAAVDGVGQRQLVPARIAPLDRDVAERDRRLDAVRPLDEVDAGGR